jgi:hypothetical protein
VVRANDERPRIWDGRMYLPEASGMGLTFNLEIIDPYGAVA